VNMPPKKTGSKSGPGKDEVRTTKACANATSFKPGNPGGPGRGNKKPRPEDAGDWRLLEDCDWVLDHPNDPTPDNAIRKALQAKIKAEPWEFIKEYNALCRRLKVGNRADEAATVARDADDGESKVEETIERILKELSA
jgi:hypothetical protein